MDRRELLNTFGAAAAGAVVLGSVKAHAAEDPETHLHLDKVHASCVDACNDCAKACNMMASHCLEQISEGRGPFKQHARSASLAYDCAAFCAISAAMMARGSELMTSSCGACAEACKSCAEACEKAPADAVMTACAKTCRDCETSCRDMVQRMMSKSRAVR
jgi:hypothetical protein